MDMKDMNLLGIVALIGAIILVVGVFLDWLVYDHNTILGNLHYSLTGMDIFNNKDHCQDNLQYSYVPIVALLCGIISLVLMIVPTFMNVEKFQQINNILGIVALVLSLVVVIVCILFMNQTISGHSLGDWGYSMGIGFWLVLVGGIITLVGGVMPILKNKGIINF